MGGDGFLNKWYKGTECNPCGVLKENESARLFKQILFFIFFLISTLATN